MKVSSPDGENDDKNSGSKNSDDNKDCSVSVSANSVTNSMGMDPVHGRRLWGQFLRETTLHGLKYVFEPAFCIRRLVWLLAVFSSAVLFASQVILRSGDYLRYDTNVDVQVVYRGEVTFPAVTVCNQNSFRLTAVADLLLYDFINAVYSADNASAIDFSRYDIDRLDTAEFIRTVAHQKKDLIESCYWKGKPCDIEMDFREQLTDLGVCYTFNAGTSGEVLVADEPGSRSGLSLVLNLEQYEYMKGPQSDAGVKILLHSQSEYPLIEDMGFAAAPGTHTLVGVNAVKVKSLSAPYGTCNNKNFPMSDCIRNCRTKQVVDRCGCKAPHMRKIPSLPGEDCRIEEYFGCVHQIRGTYVSANETNSFCDCSLACERTQYDFSLSFAQLSRFNIERVVLSDPRKRRIVWQKQFLARETFERVDDAAIAKDKEEYTDLLTYTHDLMTLVGDLHRLLAEDTLFQLMSNMSDALVSDLDTLETEFSRRRKLLSKLLRLTFDNNGPVIRPFSFTTNIIKYVNQTFRGKVVSCLDAFNRTGDTSNCDQMSYYKASDFRNIQQIGETIHAEFKKAHKTYVSIMDDIYKDTPVDIGGNVTRHQQCLRNFDNAINGMANDVFVQFLNDIDKGLLTSEHVGFISEADVVRDIVDLKRLKNAGLAFEKVIKCYTWFRDSGGQWKEDFDEAFRFLSSQSNYVGFSTTKFAKRALPRIFNIEKLLHGRVLAIVDKTSQYMNGSLFKLELHQELQSATFRSLPDVLDVTIAELLELMQTGILDLDLMEMHLRHGFQQLFRLELPVVSNEVFDHLEFLTLVRSLDNPGLVRLMDSLYTKENKTEAMLAIVSNVVDFARRPVQNLLERIRKSADRLVDVVNQQQSSLRQFADDVTTNDKFYMSNFMKVDVYYKELKFDKIEQFPAFQVLSLLGEIGGFLGLLLGASVLTLLELLDFVFVSIVNNLCRRRGQKETAGVDVKFGTKEPMDT